MKFKYELGKIEIPAHMMKELALLYQVSSDYILELSDKERDRLSKLKE